MRTSFVSNKGKTIVGWNLDLLGMETRVRTDDHGVYIEVFDVYTNMWLPLFGANNRGDFVGMPTCWPFDDRSDPQGAEPNVMMLDIDLLTQKKNFEEVRKIAESERTSSLHGSTYMSALSDKNGNVLYIIPGQGYQYFEKPEYRVMTNFSPFKMDSEKHPWMGWDRYQTAMEMLKKADESFDVKDAFEILKAVAQLECPTIVSMVFDVSEMKVYWCEDRQWDKISTQSLVK
ncbi:MAG: hypothetical protein IJM15_00375 [Erysipelotrichaceae bacterium]|nr:hypothetical protein [Erysipelotrichaceae bacterium]